MNGANTEVLEHENGLVTQGLGLELDSLSLDAIRTFLRAYAQLVILQAYGTPISSFSAVTETPNYKLGDVQNLIAEVGENLKTHVDQWRSRTAPKASASFFQDKEGSYLCPRHCSGACRDPFKLIIPC
jgi:hypothetical protein